MARMTETDLAAFLGDSYVDTTAEQRGAIADAAEAVEARYPEPDLEDVRMDALNGAMEVIFGDSTLEEVADRWRVAYEAEQRAHAQFTGALIALPEVSEAERARRAGVSRPTVRKALGK